MVAEIKFENEVLITQLKEMEETEASPPPRPDPPVVGRVTHTTIDLIWDASLVNSSGSNTSIKSISSSHNTLTHGKPKLRYVVQEEELGGLLTKGFGTVYSGYARKNEFSGLEPRTMYRYRVRAINEFGESEWSPCVEVTTTKKPASSEDLQKAVNQNDIKKAVKLLGELSKDLIDSPDKFGYSPLMIAAHKGYREMGETLIRHMADVNFQNASGKNSLMMACYAGHVELVKLLRKHGAKWEAVDNAGAGPLHWAVDGGNVELVKWMLNDGCSVDTKDYTSAWTPLMRLAATSGNPHVGRLLINQGANINATDNDRKTVLMMASLNGHTSLVKLLLSKTVNVNVESAHKKTALDFARSFDHRQIIQLLEEEQNKQLKKEKNDAIRKSNLAFSTVAS